MNADQAKALISLVYDLRAAGAKVSVKVIAR